MRSDVLVIGGGIAGCSAAYWLAQAGKKVTVVDARTLASGASGAAGAFLSPMLGMPNPMKKMVNRAFLFSVELYEKLVPGALVKKGLVRYPKAKDLKEDRFRKYEAHIDVPYEKGEGFYFFPDGSIVETEALCRKLTEKCTVLENAPVETLERTDGGWKAGELEAEIVVLATGLYPVPFVPGYLMLRGVWGERIQVATATDVPHNYTGGVGLSATRKNGEVTVGATHKPKKSEWVIDREAAEGLLEKAHAMVPLEKAEIVDVKGGMRPGSRDFFPVAGQVVDVERAFAEHPALKHGTRLEREKIPFHPGLFVHTGHGGRGFVTAPHTGELLARHILAGEPMPESLDTLRLFRKWAVQ